MSGKSRNGSRSNGKSASKNGQARRNGQNGRGNKSGSNKGQKGQQPAAKSRSRKRKKSKFNARQFWGSPAQLPTPSGYTTTTEDPIALVTSLGRPPIPGNENAAEAYFQMLYTRAGALAGALAVAGGLDQIVAVDEPDTAPDDPDFEDGADEDADADGESNSEGPGDDA